MDEKSEKQNNIAAITFLPVDKREERYATNTEKRRKG